MPRLLLHPPGPACPLLPERPRHLRQVQGQGGGLPHLQDPHGQLRLTGRAPLSGFYSPLFLLYILFLSRKDLLI